MQFSLLFFTGGISLFAKELLIADYTKAIEESSDNIKYKFLFYRGKAYLKQGDSNSAIADFSMSILSNPTREAYVERGKIYFEKGRHSSAINNFTAAIAIKASKELYKLRGKSYLAEGMYEDAIKDGTKIIELSPDDSNSYNLRMEAYARAGNKEFAKKDINKALQLDYRNKFAYQIQLDYSLTKTIKLKGIAGSPTTRASKNKVKSENGRKPQSNVVSRYMVFASAYPELREKQKNNTLTDCDMLKYSYKFLLYMIKVNPHPCAKHVHDKWLENYGHELASCD